MDMTTLKMKKLLSFSLKKPSGDIQEEVTYVELDFFYSSSYLLPQG